MSLELSLIIPSTGHLENLINISDSIAKQDCDFSKIEIIFLINGYFSELEKKKINETIKQILSQSHVYFDSQRGANRARNSGIRHSQSGLLLFLDDDCRLINKSFLQEHIDFHKKNIGVFALGGGYELPDASSFFDKVYNYIQMEWFFSGLTDTLERRACHLLGGNFSAKKEVILREALFFDESLIYGGTEYEFFKRAQSLKLLIRVIDLDLEHNAQIDFSRLVYKLYKQGRGKAMVDLKWPPAPAEVALDHLAIIAARKKLDLKMKLALLFFNYIFWLGYDRYRNGLFAFIKRLFSDLGGAFNKIRFRLFDQTQKQLEERKKNGDRF